MTNEGQQRASRRPIKPRVRKPGSKPGIKPRVDSKTAAVISLPKRTFTDPTTGEVRPLPTLDAVITDLYLSGCRRSEMLEYCLPLYGCSSTTVDRAIALAKAETWAIARAGKAERIADAAAKLDHIHKLSVEAGDRTNARLSVKDRQHILLDDRPEENGGLADTGSLEELERQMREQDELYARAKAGKDAPAAQEAPETPPNKSKKPPRTAKATPKAGGSQ